MFYGFLCGFMDFYAKCSLPRCIARSGGKIIFCIRGLKCCMHAIILEARMRGTVSLPLQMRFRKVWRRGFFLPMRLHACNQKKKKEDTMKKRSCRPEWANPEWSAVLGWLKLVRAVRAAEPAKKFFRKKISGRRGGVDNRRIGVNVETEATRETSCVTYMNRSGERSR